MASFANLPKFVPDFRISKQVYIENDILSTNTIVYSYITNYYTREK